MYGLPLARNEVEVFSTLHDGNAGSVTHMYVAAYEEGTKQKSSEAVCWVPREENNSPLPDLSIISTAGKMSPNSENCGICEPTAPATTVPVEKEVKGIVPLIGLYLSGCQSLA